MEEDKNTTNSSQNQSNPFSSGISFSTYRLENNSNSNSKGHDKQLTLGGVKKPRFKPKSKTSTSSMVSELPSVPSLSKPILVKTEPISEPQTQPKKSEGPKKPKERKETRSKSEGKKEEPKVRRGLISSGTSFFATGPISHERRPLRDAEGARRAILLDQGIEDISISQTKGSGLMEVEDDNDEDRELPEENNGPIRVPYSHSSISWKEMDEFTPPPTAELLEEVVDDELMLFSFPSFLPIYKNYPEYPQGFPNEPKGARSAEPFDFVHNNLIGIEEGCIGTMRVHQSGRVTLLIHDVEYELGVGIPMKYVEDAVYIDEDSKKVDMLGHLTQRIQVSPSLHVYDV